MPRKLARVALVLLAAATGCASLIGFPDYGGTGGAGTAGAGGAGHGATSTTGTSTGGKGTATGGKGGMGTGGMGTGGASSTSTCAPSVCVEGAPCYEGLDGTEGVGPACAGGTITCEGGVPVCSDTRPQVQQCTGGGDENCDGIPGCSGQPRWAQSPSNAASTAVAAGLDGAVALVGYSTLDVGFFAATYDAHGRQCWAVPAFNGGSGDLHPNGAAFSGAKTTPDGRIAQVVCGGACGAAFAADTIVVGSGTGPVSFVQGMQQKGAGGSSDAFIVRLDPKGNVVWGQLFGSNQDDAANAVAVDTSGNLYVTGSVGGPMTVLPCTGGADAGVPSAAGMFVAQVHPDGTCGWIKGFEGPARGTGIAVDDGGNVAVTGTFLSMGTLDVDGAMLQGVPGQAGFVIKLKPDGSVTKALSLGCLVGNVFVGITPQGGTFTMCQANPFSGCANAMYPVISLSSVAAQTASCMESDTGPAIPDGLAVDRAGNIVALLSAQGTVSSPDWGANVIANGGVVAFKLPSFGVAPAWGYAYGSQSSFSGLGLAVDGMGDVVIGATPMPGVTIGGLTLAGGTAGVAELAP